MRGLAAIPRPAPWLARLVIAGVTLASGTARAEDAGSVAAEGGFVPGVLRARVDAPVVLAATTYSAATRTASVELAGEVPLVDRVRLVLRIANVVSARSRPGAGLGVQWLDERRHGVSSTLYLVYKTEGFSEPEGELEGALSFGKFLGALYLGLDLAYGQDPEGRERDGEVAFAVQGAPARRMIAGAVGHYRDALGTSGEAGITRDLFGGASATLAVHHVGLTAMAGVAGVASRGAALALGPAATLAIGAVF